MPLSDEVADFIEQGLNRDMTKEDVDTWCDNNLDDIAEIYEKYGHSYFSYRDAEMTLFFVKTLHENCYDEMKTLVSQFVACQT